MLSNNPLFQKKVQNLKSNQVQINKNSSKDCEIDCSLIIFYQNEGYYHLSRADHILLSLRTGHNGMIAHMHTKMKVGQTDRCHRWGKVYSVFSLYSKLAVCDSV